MSENSKGLVKAGFVKDNYRVTMSSMSKKEWHKFVDKQPNYKIEEMADEEVAEEASIQKALFEKYTGYYNTGFPTPLKRFKLIVEDFNYSIESMYFWFLSQLRRDQSFHEFFKITDTFSASEQSAFWGAAQSRMKIQQDNVSQYMATIGKLIKDLFQIVRELRIIDERLDIYDKWEELKSADVTLKGLYIDLVEGASKNPSSVYGLAQQVGFTILPDLFFNTQVYTLQDVDRIVGNMKYNTSIKNVLKRKLYSYINWKIKTHKELRDRKKFQLKYLRQHWVVIKMYMDWIKPYLRNIRRMQMNEKMIESVDIISAFETSMTEIEYVAARNPEKDKPGNLRPVILMSFKYRTRPELNFQQDNYAHRGPVHVGKAELEMRMYGWTDKDIQNFKDYRQMEGFDLYGTIDESVKAAMEALGTDIEQYLTEAGEPLEKEEPEKKPSKKKKPQVSSLGMLEPFWAIFKGLFELFGAIVPTPNIELKKKGSNLIIYKSEKRNKVASAALGSAWLAYKNYKKSRRMVTW